MLLPALSRAKAAAHAAACKSNLRQIGIAMRLYVDDFGVYPFMQQGNYLVEPRRWFSDLEKYTGQKSPRPDWTNAPPRSVWICPSLAREPGMYWVNGTYGYNVCGTGPIYRKGLGLGLGGHCYSDTVITPGVTLKATRENEVRKPSAMIGIGDGVLLPLMAGTGFVNPPLEDFVRASTSYWQPPQPFQRRRHSNKLNIWFCDGHIEYLPLQNVVSRDDARLSRWNNDNQPHKDLLPPW